MCLGAPTIGTQSDNTTQVWPIYFTASLLMRVSDTGHCGDFLLFKVVLLHHYVPQCEQQVVYIAQLLVLCAGLASEVSV